MNYKATDSLYELIYGYKKDLAYIDWVIYLYIRGNTNIPGNFLDQS